jgi:hypothetical protein
MLEVSRDDAVAGEEQLVSCAAEKSKYFSISVQKPLAYLSRVGFVGNVFAAALTV